MINYDLAREFSLKYPDKVFLMCWRFANMVYIFTGHITYFWDKISEHTIDDIPNIPYRDNETYCVVANGVIMAWREPLPVCTNWEEIEVLEELEDGVGRSYFPDNNIQNLLDKKYITKIRFAPQHWVCHITERGKEYLRYVDAHRYDGS